MTITRPSDQPLTIPGQPPYAPTDWTAFGPCDTLSPIVEELHPAPGCGAATGLPCTVRGTAKPRLFPHVGRRRLDQITTPEPGPVWTNGVAPSALPLEPRPYVRHFGQHLQCADCGMVTGAAAVLAAGTTVVTCPAWCTEHEHGQRQQVDPVRLAGALSVLDDELTTDVPLRLELVQSLEPGSLGYLHLSIGHALYQPTRVVLSRSDGARLQAAVITGRALLDEAR